MLFTFHPKDERTFTQSVKVKFFCKAEELSGFSPKRRKTSFAIESAGSISFFLLRGEKKTTLLTRYTLSTKTSSHYIPRWSVSVSVQPLQNEIAT